MLKVSETEKKLTEQLSQLIQDEIIGSWRIRRCLICSMFTTAININNGMFTISKEMKVSLSISYLHFMFIKVCLKY